MYKRYAPTDLSASAFVYTQNKDCFHLKSTIA